MDTDKKLDLVLNELKKINTHLDQTDSKVDALAENLNQTNIKVDSLDRRLVNLKSENDEEHSKIIELLTSLNSAFIKYETEGLDKIIIFFNKKTYTLVHNLV